jgi:hypothetical protein
MACFFGVRGFQNPDTNLNLSERLSSQLHIMPAKGGVHEITSSGLLQAFAGMTLGDFRN